jgi:enoyl-CoA hydratase
MSVEVTHHGPVAVAVLNRPSKRNAVDREHADALRDALDSVCGDANVRAVVLTGAGGHFCAGTDVLAPPNDSDEPGGEYGVIRRSAPVPLIAAVEGYALGGGFEIALSCDLVVAAATAEFGLPEARIGLIASCGGLFRTQRSIPSNIAAELLLTGRRLTAARAHQLGFVNIVTAAGMALETALGLGAEIARCAPVPTQQALSSVRAYRRRDDTDGWNNTAHAVRATLASPDAEEGLRAFTERRTPQWHNTTTAAGD